MVILLDSGSSYSFVSSSLAASLARIQSTGTPMWVKVANGAIVQCDSYLPDATWSIQGI